MLDVQKYTWVVLFVRLVQFELLMLTEALLAVNDTAFTNGSGCAE